VRFIFPSRTTDLRPVRFIFQRAQRTFGLCAFSL
jgi:hypothetical protein